MKKYTKPMLEISVFATEDIITASSVADDDETIKGLTINNSLTETDSNATYDKLF